MFTATRLHMPRILLLLVFLVPVASAQPAGDGSLDARLLQAIYAHDSGATRAYFKAADLSAEVLFRTGVPLVFAGTYALQDAPRDFRPAYRLALAQGSATVLVYAMKYAWQRPRPYAAEEGIFSRSPHHPARRPNLSFPSGHAGISFALATSASLSHPEWYVIAPAMLWATSVSLSRPWLGVHYPSDVVAGALLGAGAAVLVHVARDALTPAFLAPDAPTDAIVVPLLFVSW